ncbi:glycosyltransferase [Polymorphobacter multimanifer]|nr:glycosyltransferase [Polymorphobacter multimanifer]
MDTRAGNAPDVFVSVGSMMPFERLVHAMDAFAQAHPDLDVLIQIGRGRTEPAHARWLRLMPPAAYKAHVVGSRLFVAHAGMGSIISAIEAGKPLLMLPRRQALGEHNTEHQMATAVHVGCRPGLYVAHDETDLVVRAAMLLADSGTAPAPISYFAAAELTARIKAFIDA